MKKIIKILTWILFLIPLIISILYITFKPQLSGIYYHNHSKYSDVSIRRDQYGIPHIKAKNFNSICYGQGFAIAQDRLFNMHIKRQIISGQLSQITPEGINSDIFFRTIGIARQAENSMKSLSKMNLECLEAYSSGINDYYHSQKIKPLEFLITGSEWIDWKPQDSMMFMKFMSFMLSLDYMFEPVRTQLAEQFGVDDSYYMTGIHPNKQLFPVTVLNDDELKQSGIYSQYKNNLTQTANQHKFHYTEQQKQQLMNSTLSQLLYELYSVEYGSNAWVIHGNYTKSGKPLLSNDPHLKNSIPSIWYQNELLIEDLNKTVHGVSLPGIPLITMGRTEFASWGVTVLYADNTDLYVEKVEGDKYFVDNEWRDLKIINETIYVKGQKEPIIHSIKFTHRGPIIDFTADFNYPNPFQKHLLQTSLSFPQLELDNTNDIFFNVIIANTTEQIRDSFANLNGPALSVVYATSNGDIGQYGTSRIPYTNYPELGPLLKDGTSTKYDWVNLTQTHENPQVINPKKGYIVTANNKFSTNNINNHYSLTVACTPRATRIDELIKQQMKEGRKFDIDDMKRIMSDTLDIYAREVIPHINNLFKTYGKEVLNNNQTLIDQAQYTLNQLNNWNHKFDADNIQASYFSAWEYLYSDKSLHSFNTTYRNRATVTKGRLFWHFQFSKIIHWSNNNKNDNNFNEMWCQNNDNKNSQYPCLYNVIMSLAETQIFLNNKFAEENSERRDWGSIHVNNFAHFPFSNTILSKLYHRTINGFGNARTVAVAIPNYLLDSFHANQGANFRFISDMSSPYDKNYYLVDTGSSENIFSTHYDDQLKMHEKFEFIEMKSGFQNFMLNQQYVFELINKSNQNIQNNKEL